MKKHNCFATVSVALYCAAIACFPASAHDPGGAAPVLGCQMDVSRSKVPTMETLAAGFAEWRHAKSLLDLDGAPDWVRDDFALLDLPARAVEAKVNEPDKRNLRAMFKPEYRRLWSRQNRLGGLKDSLAMLFSM